VHLQNGFAPLEVRSVEHHTAVKATWAEQGRVEDIRAVGGSDDNHVRVSAETIHLYQELVEGLFAFVMTAAKTCPAVATYRVDFINKDDTRRMLFRLAEKVTHAAGADANEHLHKF